MTSGTQTIIFPVHDISAATRLYSRLLGVAPYVDEPYYVGFNVDGQEIGLDPDGHSKGLTGPLGYWHVDDIKATLAELITAGAQAQLPVTAVGGGKLVATASDPDGNVIGLLQAPAGSST